MKETHKEMKKISNQMKLLGNQLLKAHKEEELKLRMEVFQHMGLKREFISIIDFHI